MIYSIPKLKELNKVKTSDNTTWGSVPRKDDEHVNLGINSNITKNKHLNTG